MTITTKYNVGDRVWTLDEKTMKAKEFEVQMVSVFAHDSGKVHVAYSERIAPYDTREHDEEKCFPSRETLIDHIMR